MTTITLAALDTSTMAQTFLDTIPRRENAVALWSSDGATEIPDDELLDRMRATRYA